MKEKGKYTIVVVSAIVMLVSILGYTYSFFSAKVKEVNKTETKIKTNELGIKFTGQTEISCTSMVPGNKCIKTFKVENTSSVKTFYNIYMENITNEFNEDLVYTLTDDEGTVVSETALPTTGVAKTYLKNNIELEVNGIKNYTLTIEFKYTDKDQNDYQGANFIATVGIDTVQNITPSTNNPSSMLCRRATTLHMETCDSTNPSSYCSGAIYDGNPTVTYGNLGTRGSLTSGDAFDCDVNGDGIYNATSERFYYVTDYYNTTTKEFEEDTAVLIYYSNVSEGEPNNTAAYIYDSNSVNNRGPISIVNQLPTTEQWSNVQLKNSERKIINENGDSTTSAGSLPTNFSYEGYAARFLTLQEATNASNVTAGSRVTGELDEHGYFLENTWYINHSVISAYWLETPRSTDGYSPWFITGNGRMFAYGNGSNYGVRPVIEVSKTNMEI